VVIFHTSYYFFQTSLPRNAFHALRHLSTLDVSNNTIVEIGSAFTDMPELKYLDLSYNHLPIVKRGAFRNLPSLVGLRLDYNSIISLEEESFTDLLSLETLILTKNGIAAIRRGTFRNLPSLEKLPSRSCTSIGTCWRTSQKEPSIGFRQ